MHFAILGIEHTHSRSMQSKASMFVNVYKLYAAAPASTAPIHSSPNIRVATAIAIGERSIHLIMYYSLCTKLLAIPSLAICS